MPTHSVNREKSGIICLAGTFPPTNFGDLFSVFFKSCYLPRRIGLWGQSPNRVQLNRNPSFTLDDLYCAPRTLPLALNFDHPVGPRRLWYHLLRRKWFIKFIGVLFFFYAKDHTKIYRKIKIECVRKCTTEIGYELFFNIKFLRIDAFEMRRI